MAQYPPKPSIRCSGPRSKLSQFLSALPPILPSHSQSSTHANMRYFARHEMLFLSLINGGVICNCANVHLWLIVYQHRPCVALCYSSKSYGHQNLVAIKISCGTWLRKVHETSRHADRFGGPEDRHSSFSMKFPQQQGIHTVANANITNT